jgi:hypothetical protein
MRRSAFAHAAASFSVTTIERASSVVITFSTSGADVSQQFDA